MQDPTDRPPNPLAELRALLAGGFTRWEAWRGVSGLVYARRRMSSPPVVFRGVTAQAVAEQISKYEEARS